MFIALLFAILALHGFFCKLKIRKDILKAITKNKVLINQQSEQNKAKITASLLSINSPELEQLIEKLMATEYECYKTLTTAYIDYHPAAVNIIPLILNQISTSFMSCMDYVHAHTQIVSDNGDPAVDSNVEQSEKLVDNQEEDIDDLFQYEALIEQLRVEKQTYADKCSHYSAVLDELFHLHKDNLAWSADKPIAKMSFSELETAFKLKKQG
jgi:hypothetical protein